MSIANMVTMLRGVYHTEMVDVVNAANQLHIIKDAKADELNKQHVMKLITDIWPRLYGQEAVDKLLNK